MFCIKSYSEHIFFLNSERLSITNSNYLEICIYICLIVKPKQYQFMTNSIKISPQRTSFILSVSVILYWATDSYLYLSCHINLMEYSTPVILYITAMILACGVLKHFFFRFITKNELSLSFGKQVRPLPEQIKEIDPECPKDKDINRQF